MQRILEHFCIVFLGMLSSKCTPASLWSSKSALKSKISFDILDSVYSPQISQSLMHSFTAIDNFRFNDNFFSQGVHRLWHGQGGPDKGRLHVCLQAKIAQRACLYRSGCHSCHFSQVEIFWGAAVKN